MDQTHRTFARTAEAGLMLTVMSWTFTLAYSFFVHDMSVHGAAVTVAVVAVPDAVATWWIFRRLRADRPRVDAQRAALAFAFSAPVALAVGNVLGAGVGSYAEQAFGKSFVLPSVAAFIILLMVVIPNAVVAWALHASGGVAPVGGSGQDEHR